MVKKSLKILLLQISLIVLHSAGHTQSPQILRHDPLYHTADRMDILRLNDTFLISSINNFNRKEIIEYLFKSWQSDELSMKDRYDLVHAFRDNIEFSNAFVDQKEGEENPAELFRNSGKDYNNEVPLLQLSDLRGKPFLKHFYKSYANFLELETPSFSMYINPILHVAYGKEKGNESPVFQNTRGLEVRAYIDKKVYFYTQLLETQRSFLNYQNNRIAKYNTIPGQGLYKSYNSSVIDALRGYDYFNARGYIGFNATKSINIELGHGNHFLGNGFRSLLLSDFSHNYFYLKLNTRIWKFQYQNIFAELAPVSVQSVPGDILLPKKFSATHYLAFAPHKNFEIGLFETVIFAREKVFEFQYLNPVILYRAVEHSLGSPDNVMLGLNMRWNPIRGISLYGQLVLDEFKLDELKGNTGWWANKYGIQSGIKYINVLGIDHLDLQLEYNTVRPYTYTHRDTLSVNAFTSVANYSHHSQPLAHQIGANFKETVMLLRYRPTEKLQLNSRVLLTQFGDDPPGRNWGSNVLLPLDSREMDYGNVTGQGLKTDIRSIYLDAQYEFMHNFFADLNCMFRKTTVDNVVTNSTYVGAGIRINIGTQNFDY